jgi:hypothetical protein
MSQAVECHPSKHEVLSSNLSTAKRRKGIMLLKLTNKAKRNSYFLKLVLGQAQWLKPVILAMSEAKIRRITVQGKPEQKSSRDPPSQPVTKCSGAHLSY